MRLTAEPDGLALVVILERIEERFIKPFNRHEVKPETQSNKTV